MTGAGPGGGKGRRRPDPPATPVVLVVQVIALLGLIAYSLLALWYERAVDTTVVAALLAFGVGLRPASIARVLRRVLDDPAE